MNIPDWGGKNKFMSRQSKGVDLYKKWVNDENTLVMNKMKKGNKNALTTQIRMALLWVDFILTKSFLL